jgi:hypothetical protein
MIGLLPAAGDALRMNGIPKFMLPLPDYKQTLISWHIEKQLEVCTKVIIATKPENAILFKNFIKDSRVFLLIVESQTVSETILKMIEAFPSVDYIFGMPDTFFVGENPYKILLNDEYSDLNLALWKIEKDQIGTLGQIKLDNKNNIIDIKDKDSKCKYELFWGAMRFNLNFINFINKNDSHPGLAIKPAITNNIKYKTSIINGKYFDCGTMDQYKKMIMYDVESL